MHGPLAVGDRFGIRPVTGPPPRTRGDEGWVVRTIQGPCRREDAYMEQIARLDMPAWKHVWFPVHWHVTAAGAGVVVAGTVPAVESFILREIHGRLISLSAWAPPLDRTAVEYVLLEEVRPPAALQLALF